MKVLIPMLLAGMMLHQTAPAKESANPVDPRIGAGAVAAGAQKPAGAQRNQTDQKFLTEHARRSGAINAMHANLKAIQMRAKALDERLRALEKAATGASTPGKVLLDRKAETPGAVDTEERIPQTLKHKDRAVDEIDDYGRIKVRLSALGESAQSELAKLKELERQRAENSTQITSGDRAEGSSLPMTEDVHTDEEDAALRLGQKTVNQLQSDLDALTIEIEDLERQNGVSVSKKPGRLK